jgi:hypothetical protein
VSLVITSYQTNFPCALDIAYSFSFGLHYPQMSPERQQALPQSEPFHVSQETTILLDELLRCEQKINLLRPLKQKAPAGHCGAFSP